MYECTHIQVRYTLPVTEGAANTADMWISDRLGNKYNHFEVSCLSITSDDDDIALKGAERGQEQEVGLHVCAILVFVYFLYVHVCTCMHTYVFI
jgi:hypothetical protein